VEERKLTKEDIDRVRGIEGFPIAKDEDIIALSRPPYYTACPNPFIEDFIRKHGTPYDEATDNYHREPFAADVSEGKNDPIYMAHGYHTKVPYKAIMRYILHYTKPGDLVFDGFCGTGMSGLAAQMCGSTDATLQMQMMEEMQNDKVEWGARTAIVSDLSPAATFIAYNYNSPVVPKEFQVEAERVISETKRECAWMYETQHMVGGKVQLGINGKPIIGNISYTVWSDVLICPNCTGEFTYWDVAVDLEKDTVKTSFTCPHCGCHLVKRDCRRALIDYYDEGMDKTLTIAKQSPVLIHYKIGNTRYTKVPDHDDFALIEKINNTRIPYWYPTNPLPEGDNTEQPKRSHGVIYVHQFFTKRNLYTIATAFSKAKEPRVKFMLTAVMKTMTKMYRYAPHGKCTAGMPGTLYLPSATHEYSIFDALERRVRIYGPLNEEASKYINNVMVSCGDLASTNVPENSIDYIFTDPPFGGNLNYSELSFLWEAWLKVRTNNKTEAIMNKTQEKGLPEYQSLMERCFRAYHRVLKPGHWMTVEFHNSYNAVWNAITEALLRAGFIVADVRTLDKKQNSFKQATTATAVKQDLVISAYKPKESFVREFESRAGDPEMVWEFVRQHLQNVPIAPDSTGKIEVVSERQDYLLFDRMVAFHIMNGIPVPMDAYTFYAGLRERFIQRDGMFFLADQVNEYDERRQKMELQDQQLSLFISDEKSAIMWLNAQLTQARQSYSDIQPKYLQELHQTKFEQMPELLDMLKENFLQDNDGKWYVPDLSDKVDLEKLRRKRLLKEFYDIYAKGTGRIKNARTEAIRVGFDECWKERNYSLIVKVGDRLPETVLQEDVALLMYYDNAANRM